MCGIVGYVGPETGGSHPARGLETARVPRLRLGGNRHALQRRLHDPPRPGKLCNLVEKLSGVASVGTTGIGHTRWATHGRPTEVNAHPHTDCTGKIVVVHNGIFENFAERKAALAKAGHRFTSETDTEVFAHEVEAAFQGDLARGGARRRCEADRRLRRARVLEPRAGRPRGRPLGPADRARDSARARTTSPRTRWRSSPGRATSSSSRTATSRAWTRRACAIVQREGRPASSGTVHRILWDAVAAEKGGYRHFMAKEIHEQPTAIAETLGGKVSLGDGGDLTSTRRSSRPSGSQDFDRVLLLACGTSWHSALVGKFLIEGMARIPVEVDYGSEFRYRRPVVDGPHPDDRHLAVRRDGRHRRRAVRSAARGLADRRDRERARQPDRPHGRRGLPTHAGPEIGVASTKAFTTQLAVLFLLAAKLRAVARARDRALDRGASASPGAPSRRRSARRSRARAADRGAGAAATSTRATSSSSAAGSTTRWRSRAP